MIKHTDGPWAVDPFTNAVVAYAGSRKMVAIVYGDDPTSRPDLRSKANAMLIAASPVMLATLRSVIANCADLCDPETISEVRAAVFQATGDA